MAALLFGGLVALAQGDRGAVPNVRLSSASPGELTISWDAPDPAPSDYRVIWAEQGLDFLSYKNSNEANRGNEYPSGEKRSITLTGLTKGETFKVMARARYTSGGRNNGPWSGPWTDTVTAQVQDDPPAAPTGLTASQVAHDSVTLTWTAPSRGTVTGYRVLRGTDANSLSAIAQDTGSAGAEYTDSTVAAETTYHYAVLALSADGDGAQSNTASATTPAPPKKRGDNRVSPRQTVPTSITLVSNTGQTSGGVGSLGSHDQAQAFTTGDNSAGYTLTSVLVVFQLLGTASTNYVVSIRNDSSGAPGTLVGALMGPATLTTRSTFTASGSGLTLSADTTYFFMIDSSAGDENKTQNTTSDNEDTGAQSGWSIADGSLYRDRATTGAWTAFGESKKIEIKGTAIPDTTAPAFASAAANGTSLVITFDEDLAAAASLANGAFPVKKTPSGGSEATVTLSATSGPVISGKTVTLTLGTALVSTDGSVKVSYTKPTSGTANKLVDAAANETATFPDQPVTNNTPAAQTVTTFISNTGQTDSIAGGLVSNTKYFAQQFMTGSNTGGYSLSAIVVEIHTGSAATPAFALHQSTTVSGVEVPGTKVVNLTGSITTAGEQSFTPDTTTTLSASTKYFVVLHTVSSSVLLQRTNSDDEDSGGSTGWEIADNYVVSLNSGSTWLTSLESVEIAVKGTAVATDATAPAFASAAANGASLVITFDEDLAAAASLANGAFTVEKTPSGGSEATVTLSTTSGPVISGKTVTLTLATALVSTDTAVKVSYTKPATGTANKLVDAAANATATFTDQPVTNNTPAAQVVSIEAVHPKASPFLADVEFRVTRAPVMTTPLTVTLSITQTARYLFNTAPTITIPANQTSAVGKYNSFYSGTTSGTVTATVVAGTGYAPATAPANAATVTFAAHPRPLTMGWASDTYTVSEGDTLSAGVTLRTRDGAPKPRDTFTIGFETLSGTALPSTATVTNDYVHQSVRPVVEPAAWSADGMAFVATALVTVATVEDSVDEDDEQFSIATSRSSAEAAYDRTCTAAHHVGTGGVECRTFVTITDDDTRGVTLSAATLTVNEGSTGTYTVKLDSQPTASVTVTPSKTGSSDVTFAPASLTFLTSNWSATQTVTVTAADDSDAADDTATISHAVAGGDYGSVTAASVVVTVDDDESADTTAPAFESAAANGASLVITFDETLAAAASLGNSAFTVKKTPSGGSEATVTLSTTTGPVISGRTVTLTLATALVSTDGSVKVSYTKPTTGSNNKLVDAAANATATFTDQTVTNNTPAPGDATAFISNTGQTESRSVGSSGDTFFDAQQFTTGSYADGYSLSAIVVKISAASLATPAFALYQSTTVNGVDEPGTKVVDLTGSVATAGEQSFTPASATTLSASTKYFVVVASSSVSIITSKTRSGNEDSGGSPGWSIADNSLYTINSGGTWASSTTLLKIAVKGTRAPTDTTAPAFESAAANGTSLVITFDENLAPAASLANSAFTVKKTPSGGSEATVTLSTTVAPVISGRTVTLTLATALVSTDTAVKVSYTKPTTGSNNKLVDAAANETATFTDQPVTNNTPAAATTPVITIAAGTSPVTEGTAAAFTLTRTGSATAALTVNVSVSESGDMVAAANEGAKTATFTANSATATLSVATVGDSVDEANSVVTATVTAIPATYTVGTPASGTVTVQDNDTRGVTVSAATLTVNEGSTGTYTVKLDSQPTASVTVTPSKTGSSDVTFAPASLTFLTSNWSATQTVTVTAADDSDAADDTATISHAVAGGDYGSVTAASVVVTVDDDETTDTTAPAFESAAANGTSLVITFDENLAAAASLVNSAFTVKKTPSGGSEATVTLSTTTGPVISGKTATLTLATTLVSTDTAVKVTYTKPSTGTANKLVDAAANETATFTDQTVTNNTPAPGDATTFISNTGQTDIGSLASIFGDVPSAQQFTTGSNVGGYTLSAVVVIIRNGSTATPAFALHQSTTVSGVEVPGTKVVDLTGSITTAGEQSFTPATTTTLSASTKYFVLLSIVSSFVNIRTTNSADEDSGGSTGWEIADNYVLSTDSGSTWLSFDASFAIAVKGTAVATVTDTTAPAFESAAANGASLVITFDEDLAAAASLANSAFTVKKTPSGGSEATVTLSATAPVISGRTVTLTLATALVSTDTAVKVTYTAPTTGSNNKLVDAASNATVTFTDQTVTNNTPATDTTPVITIAAGTSSVTKGTAAAFTLTRTGSATAELSVNVTVSESGDMVAAANEGAKTATFTANSATATLSVATVGDSVDEANSVVTATVTVDTATPATYTVGTPASATVTVTDNDRTPPSITGGGGGGFGPALVALKFVDGFRTSRTLTLTARVGDAVGDPVAATHPRNSEITYSLSGTDAARFTVDEETGQIRLGQAITLALGQTYTVNLTATDTSGTGAIIIVAIEVGEAPYHRYDLNRNGSIEKNEALAAVGDYFGGVIEKPLVLEVVSLYFAA